MLAACAVECSLGLPTVFLLYIYYFHSLQLKLGVEILSLFFLSWFLKKCSIFFNVSFPYICTFVQCLWLKVFNSFQTKVLNLSLFLSCLVCIFLSRLLTLFFYTKFSLKLNVLFQKDHRLNYPSCIYFLKLTSCSLLTSDIDIFPHAAEMWGLWSHWAHEDKQILPPLLSNKCSTFQPCCHDRGTGGGVGKDSHS